MDGREGAAYARGAAAAAVSAASSGLQLDDWTSGADSSAQRLVAALSSEVLYRSAHTVQPKRLKTAENWLDGFLLATQRVPFRDLEHSSDLDGMRYNARTKELLTRYIRNASASQRGRPITSDAVAGYVSAIFAQRSRIVGYDILTGKVGARLAEARRSERKEEGPPSERRPCLGIGGADFDTIYPSMDFALPSHRMDWGVGHAAYAATLRAGEVGTVDNGVLEAARDLVISSVDPQQPTAASSWCPWLYLNVCSIKDSTYTRSRVPIPIRRRSAGATPLSDPRCSYDAIMAVYAERCRTVPQAEWATAPLFVTPSGSHWESADVLSLARRWAPLLGIDPAKTGGKAFRIKSASDLRDQFGADGERIIRERGRWWSDVDHIYSRASLQRHLHASATMADGDNTAIERAHPSWVQPAWR